MKTDTNTRYPCASSMDIHTIDNVNCNSLLTKMEQHLFDLVSAIQVCESQRKPDQLPPGLYMLSGAQYSKDGLKYDLKPAAKHTLPDFIFINEQGLQTTEGWQGHGKRTVIMNYIFINGRRLLSSVITATAGVERKEQYVYSASGELIGHMR